MYRCMQLKVRLIPIVCCINQGLVRGFRRKRIQHGESIFLLRDRWRRAAPGDRICGCIWRSNTLTQSSVLGFDLVQQVCESAVIRLQRLHRSVKIQSAVMKLLYSSSFTFAKGALARVII